jgi:hypothetical protein
MYKANAPRFALKGIEIFSAGKHREGEEAWTEADLDAIVAAHSQLDYRPALKAGHQAQDGQPALGWIENVRREGKKLLADITDVPGVVVDAIKSKAYDRVSAEIYSNLKRGGKEFKHALKALALLGADINAVPGLKPLHQMEFAEGTAVKDYHVDALAGTISVTLTSEQATDFLRQFSTKDDDMDPKELQAQIDAAVAKATEAAEAKAKTERAEMERRFSEQREADQKALAALSAKERARDVLAKADLCKIPALRPALAAAYSMAFDAPVEKKYSVEAGKEVSPVDVLDSLVKTLNEGAVAKLFAVDASKGGVAAARRVADDAQSVSDEVDERVRKYRAEHPETSYQKAFNIVLDADPELKKQYAAA